MIQMKLRVYCRILSFLSILLFGLWFTLTGCEDSSTSPATPPPASSQNDVVTEFAKATGWKEKEIRAALTGTRYVGEKQWLEQIKAHLAKGGSSNDICDIDRQRTWLHTTALLGHSNALKYLLDHGGNVNVKRKMTMGVGDQTPLHYASNPEVVEVLLNYKANLEGCDTMNMTPLLTAAYMAYPEVVSALAKAKADVHAKRFFNQGAITITCSRLAIDYGDPNLNRRKEGLQAIRRLVELGVDVNDSDKWGKTALHYASQYDHQYVALLLELGADPHAKDEKNNKPIDLAPRSEKKVIALLTKEMKTNEQRKMVVAHYVRELGQENLSIERQNILFEKILDSGWVGIEILAANIENKSPCYAMLDSGFPDESDNQPTIGEVCALLLNDIIKPSHLRGQKSIQYISDWKTWIDKNKGMTIEAIRSTYAEPECDVDENNK